MHMPEQAIRAVRPASQYASSVSPVDSQQPRVLTPVLHAQLDSKWATNKLTYVYICAYIIYLYSHIYIRNKLWSLLITSKHAHRFNTEKAQLTCSNCEAGFVTTHHPVLDTSSSAINFI